MARDPEQFRNELETMGEVEVRAKLGQWNTADSWRFLVAESWLEGLKEDRAVGAGGEALRDMDRPRAEPAGAPVRNRLAFTLVFLTAVTLALRLLGVI